MRAGPDEATDPAFLVTRRELAVLTFALSMTVGAVLLLLVATRQVSSALFGPG
ncbi:MAG: hypothetical protein WKF86_09380 [Acidimicrobiales bacterium]